MKEDFMVMGGALSPSQPSWDCPAGSSLRTPPCIHDRNSWIAAFTLIELSVVLVIIALLTGLAVSSGISVVASARLVTTNQRMAAIDQALIAFRNANDRIPCPADLSQT